MAENAWFARLQEETNDLRIKIGKLKSFLDKDDNSISAEQIDLLKRQVEVMQEYYEILRLRIDLIEKEYEGK
jgi:uncharacterized protein YdcH (DUF465 family)